MAGGLKNPQHLSAAALAALGSIAGLAGAQALQDPTKPPATAMEQTPSKMGSGVGAHILQTVILSRGRKPVALINGQMVELGGKLNDATLVKLTESEAVLQGPSGKEVLQLTPAAEKLSKQKTNSAKSAAKGADKTMRQTKPSPKQADHD